MFVSAIALQSPYIRTSSTANLCSPSVLSQAWRHLSRKGNSPAGDINAHVRDDLLNIALCLEKVAVTFKVPPDMLYFTIS